MRTVIPICLLLLVISSCKKKYPEGGNFSIISKKARLENSWVFEAVYTGDEAKADSTEYFVNTFRKYNMVINRDGTYGCYYIENNVEVLEGGKWNFTIDKKIVQFTSSSGGAYYWIILRLKNKELWVTDTHFTGANMEIHFMPKN